MGRLGGGFLLARKKGGDILVGWLASSCEVVGTQVRKDI